ncbi:hypothetical protein LAZ67_22001840 [Cordylochernes scorpioides]|uniref:Transposase n=1 Tax=Cordylochernes scorpioides TaxID=51811 RepID=A0ABY6LTH1_9ARAC|nr:hypothetical protein LAZ67_22001840 [Cordylochernes scorpioides]
MPGHRKRRQFKQTDAFTRGMVIGLKRAGWSIRQIAADTHLGASMVHRLWRRWLEQGNVAIYRNVGATRVTSARVDRRILRQAVAAPQATCTAILQHVQDTLDHSISTRTISRRLVANGLHSCRPLRRLPLTPPNRRQRLEWCRARSTWMTEWHRVVFSDESRFCLSRDSRRVRVWRRRGERSNPAAIVERPAVRQRGIMVWGAIAYDSRSPLLRIQGTMTAQRYVDDVLRPVTLPYLQGVPNALYQQDNARPHTARISQQALQDVQMLPWPPYSPDLSPIEHVWDIIGRRLHALPQPRSEDELWQMVEREWRAIPQDAIRTLIDPLPRRVAACIAVRGHCCDSVGKKRKLGEKVTAGGDLSGRSSAPHPAVKSQESGVEGQTTGNMKSLVTLALLCTLASAQYGGGEKAGGYGGGAKDDYEEPHDTDKISMVPVIPVRRYNYYNRKDTEKISMAPVIPVRRYNYYNKKDTEKISMVPVIPVRRYNYYNRKDTEKISMVPVIPVRRYNYYNRKDTEKISMVPVIPVRRYNYYNRKDTEKISMAPVNNVSEDKLGRVTDCGSPPLLLSSFYTTQDTNTAWSTRLQPCPYFLIQPGTTWFIVAIYPAIWGVHVRNMFDDNVEEFVEKNLVFRNPICHHVLTSICVQYPPSPYKFGYDVKDEYGNTVHQTEEGDDHGNKRGSYGYVDAYGIHRTVEYVADEHGFRATIKTNEPGTSNSDPADVHFSADPVEVAAKQQAAGGYSQPPASHSQPY